MERFWSKVEKSEGCWTWLAKKQNKGYGLFRYQPEGKSWGWIGAHRMAYLLERGAIPEGKWVLHHCDNRSCVRPDHLFIGDHVDNMRDMHSKGRGRQILVPADVHKIRALRARGVPRKQVAAQFGVSVDAVKNITMGKSWKHV